MKHSGLTTGIQSCLGAAPAALAGAILAAVLIAAPARAQPVPAGADPIGDVLSGLAGEQGMDDDTAEAGATSDTDDAAPAPPAGPLYRPNGPAATPQPRPYVPPPAARPPQLDRPVMIDELWRSPEAPQTPTERAYDSRIKGGFSAAQGRQGPLDGEWVVRGPDGKTLYGLLLVDKGTGAVTLEGAWRDLKPGQPAGRVGLIDSVERSAGAVFVRFIPTGAKEALVLTLNPAGDAWSGELWERGATRRVTMRRK